MATLDYGGKKEIMFEVRGLTTGAEGGLPHRGNVVGNLFYGVDGWMALDGGSFQVYKGEKNEKIMDEKAERGDETVIHMKNFVSAVKSRKHTDLTADVEVGVRSVALVHVSNISYRLGRKLNFDPKTMKFIGDGEANKMLTRAYRAPYVVPEKV